MSSMIAKCGCDCFKCPTYQGNLQTAEARRRCSAGWEKYLDIRLSPEKLLPCDGCQVSDEKRKVYYLNCRVRKCAMHSGLDNCAHCSAYPCEELRTLRSVQDPDIRQKIAARIGAPIPEEDYLLFIEPYEGLKHLDVIRASLEAARIREPTMFSLKTRIVEFPSDLSFPKTEKLAFESLHHLLAALNGPVSCLSYARRDVLKKRRPGLLRLLWTFGLHGRLDEQEQCCLIVDSPEYYREKNQGVYSRVNADFECLEGFGVHCELVRLVGDGWLTPGGGLRKTVGRKKEPAWRMKMSFLENRGGLMGLRALQKYCAGLRFRYGQGAFRYLSRADMRMLAG